jgi:hypothetical protein
MISGASITIPKLQFYSRQIPKLIDGQSDSTIGRRAQHLLFIYADLPLCNTSVESSLGTSSFSSNFSSLIGAEFQILILQSAI